jgi:peptidoglycan/LPS O-acetylase OafA/YrhL
MQVEGSSTIASTEDATLRPTETSTAAGMKLPPATPRFAFVDGLRGFSALAIVIFHIWNYEPAPYPAFEYTPWIVDATFRHVLRTAVQVLLVISGFVVAYTLRKTLVTPQEIVWFLGRRVVRLMPAYWVTIAIIILVDILCQQVWNLSSPFDGTVSVKRLSAHLTLLQDIMGDEALSAGIWTICIEMQFYVVAILGWGLAQNLVSRPDPNTARPSVWGLMAVFVPAALVSLFYFRSLKGTDPFVVRFLWMFFLGMVTWWTLDKTIPEEVYAMVIAVGLAELINSEWRIPNAVALTTSLAIFTAGKLGRFPSWLNWRWLQYLGRISYSLYLIHFPVCHLLTGVGWKWCNDSPTPFQADVILLVSLLASVGAAHVLYMLVEAPSNRWSALMKQKSEQTAARPMTELPSAS